MVRYLVQVAAGTSHLAEVLCAGGCRYLALGEVPGAGTSQLAEVPGAGVGRYSH